MTDSMLIQLDTENRARALTHASFIVEAPAGAGKTELLTQRYLSLLASVDDPEEIIALTFTNKAAAEMRNRILHSLARAQKQVAETEPHKLKTRALANAALAHSLLKGWDILSQPSRLRILTIDALCSSLTRQMPLLSKFGGQPRVSDDTEAHYAEASLRTIASIRHETGIDGPVSVALRYLDNDSEKLCGLLAKMLARRDQWLPLAGRLYSMDVEEMAYNTAQALQALIAEKLQLGLQVLPATLQIQMMPLVRFAASNLAADDDMAVLLDWNAPLSDQAEDLILWQALINVLVTQRGEYRKTITKAQGFPADKIHKEKKDAMQMLLGQLENSEVLASISALPALANLDESQPVIEALTKLLMLATTHLWTIFQAAGEVDFVAIAQSAQQALENEQGATDLALKLDYQISHLLIDEFQDTSPVQMQLIEKLIAGWQPDDGRTLFCVGDPMQSIYRFRKAEVSLFLQAAQNGIAHLPLIRLQLSRNNRSHPAVVNWINSAFMQAFPSDDNINQGAISYRPFSATRPSVDGEGVFIHPLVLGNMVATAPEKLAQDNDVPEPSTEDSEQLNLNSVEAAYVAGLIATLREENINQQASRKIAVLVRSRSHLKDLVSQMRRHYPQLKFQAVEIEALNDRQTIQDAYSLLRALQHRADRVHWLNLLRAPWCGLCLHDLHALAADDHHATLWQLMHDTARIQTLSADGQLRLAHLKHILTTAFETQGRLPKRRWLESTWLRLGGAQCLVNAGDQRDIQAFFDLVEKVSLAGYIDMTALDSGMQKLYAKPDIDASEDLQFLTIHKSKGLEFDTVILPALNRMPRNPDHELVLWQEVMVDGHLHLLAAPFTATKKVSSKLSSSTSSVYTLLKSLERERSDNEIVRLLYVAATRAQRQLHLIAGIEAGVNGNLIPNGRSLLNVLWSAVETSFTQATPLQPTSIETRGLDLASFTPQLQRLHSTDLGNQSGLNESMVAVGAADNMTHALAPNMRLADYFSAPDLQRDCGTLAHKYMELFADQFASSAAELQPESALQMDCLMRLHQCVPAMQRWLVAQGQTQSQAEKGAIFVADALRTTVQSDAGLWVLRAHEAAANELRVLQIEAEGVEKQHVIDRTFLDDGVRWIIDYKLNHADETSDWDRAARAHLPQLERYAALFATTNTPVKKAVLFLNVGKLVVL